MIGVPIQKGSFAYHSLSSCLRTCLSKERTLLMKLTTEENAELARLIRMIEWPTDLEVFYALCEKTVMSSIELAILQYRYRSPVPEILLIERHDPYFDGWHMPGSIVYPGRNAKKTISLILKREAGVEATHNTPRFIETSDVMQGDGPGQCRRGQEIHRLFLVILAPFEFIPTTDVKKFFPLYRIPADTLPHHKVMIEYICRDLNI